MKQIKSVEFEAIAGRGKSKEKIEKLAKMIETAKAEKWEGGSILFKEDLQVDSLHYSTFTTPLRKMGYNVKAVDACKEIEKQHHYKGLAFSFKK